MKLRKPWLIHLVAFFAAGIVRLWMGSLRYRSSFRGGSVTRSSSSIEVSPERTWRTPL